MKRNCIDFPDYDDLGDDLASEADRGPAQPRRPAKANDKTRSWYLDERRKREDPLVGKALEADPRHDPYPERNTREPQDSVIPEFDFYRERLPRDRPLIFLPGIMGTRLRRARVGAANLPVGVWPPVRLSSLNLVDLDLLLEPVRPVSGTNPLVDQAYDQLVAFLEDQLGYRLGRDLFIFGYNWTQSCHLSGQRFAGYIKTLVNAWDWGNTPKENRKPDIICHSMGGLVTRSAANIWGAPIGRVAYVASPHYGTPMAYGAVHEDIDQIGLAAAFGINLVNRFVDLKTGLDVNRKLNRVARQLRGIYDLLPAPEFFRRQLEIAEVYSFFSTNTPVAGRTETYTTNPATRLSLQDYVEQAEAFHNTIGVELPGDIVFNIPALADGAARHTASRYVVPSGDTPDGRLVGSAAGDGTVVFEASARGPGREYNTTYALHAEAPNVLQTHKLLALFLAAT